MPAIFISHSSLDPQIANDIKTALDRLGFEKVFLDFNKETGIGVGEGWEKRLYEELSRCHAVILVLTPNWLASTWCRIELAQARALGKVILPIVCAPIGDRYVLPEVQSVDLVNWKAGGLERIEQRLRAITNELARGFKLDPNRPPYPGIHAFEAEDAAIYFGRDDETRALIERLDARRTQGGARFLVVIGASGSGKSSLLKAGALPQLSRRRSEWVVLPCIRPEKAPVETFAKSIAQQIGKPEDWRVWQATLGRAVAIDHIEELLKDLRVGDARAATVLLPIDQFEEVFTVATPAERAIFLHLLASALDPARDLPVMVIATGRSDVLEGLLEAGELALLSETYPLTPMPLDRVPRLVEGPAQVAGLNVEKGLAEALARDVESSKALPLLAHTLWLLYRRGSNDKKLSLAEYQSLGDPERGLNPIQNSVRVVADQAIGGLKPTDAELAALRDAFVPHLVRVRLDDGKRVRQPARLSELPGEALRLIRALVEARLLSTRAADESDGAAKDGGEAVVEVTHEALFKAWPTLDQWLTEEHAFLSDIERIKSAHEMWTQAPDAQKARALLGGLLLSRARDWLLKYPQRFLSHDMAALRAVVTASAEAEDDENARKETLRRQAAEAETRRQQQEIEALARDNARLAEIAVTQVNLLTEVAETENLRGNLETALKLCVHAARRDLESQPRMSGASRASATLAAIVSRSGWRLNLSGHENAVRSAAFSPDGSRIVTASIDRTARIWDAATGKEIAILQHDRRRDDRKAVLSAAFSPEGARIVTASGDRTARIWNAVTGKEITVLHRPDSSVRFVAFSPDGSRIVTAAEDEARIWDAATGKDMIVLRGHRSSVQSAAFSPDGSEIVTASEDMTARIWDAATGEETTVLSGHSDSVLSAAFSPDGSRVVTASRDETVRVWDADKMEEIMVLRGHEGSVLSAAFRPDGSQILTAGDKTARIWDAATGSEITVLSGHSDSVLSAAFSPDGSRIVTASSDRTARIWDAATGRGTTVLRGHERIVESAAAFSPDRSRIVTASEDSTARIWDAATGEKITVLCGLVRSAAFSPDGSRIVTASRDRTARIWDAATGRETTVLRGHEDLVHSAVFSADGSRIVTASGDMTARIWDAATGKEITVLSGHSDSVLSAAFSPHGSRIVTASEDMTARIWDAAIGEQITVLRGHNRSVLSAAFSSDGSRIVTASRDRTARIWDASRGKEITVLRGHSDSVWSAAFSPDSWRILTASSDGTARIWHASTSKEITVLRGHEGSVLSAAFSPDGSRIVTASLDRTARIWDAATGEEITVLRGHERSVLTAAFSPDGSRIFRKNSLTFAAFSPDGSRIVTASGDTNIWDAATGKEIVALGGHESPYDDSRSVLSAAFSPDGSRIVTGSVVGSKDNNARVWDAATGKEITVLRGHNRYVLSAAFSPDGSRIVTASEDGTARIWDAATGREITVLPGHESSMGSAGFSPNGSRIFTAADDAACIWDAATGKEVTVLRGYEGTLWSTAFSPDGSRMASWKSWDNTARIWDAETGEEITVLRGRDVRSAAFSPDGSHIVTASRDRTARIWDVATGMEITLRGHKRAVLSAAFSPDGSRIVTASEDGTARIWDAATGKEITVLSGHSDSVLSAAFSPDGSRIVTASEDGTARIWDARFTTMSAKGLLAETCKRRLLGLTRLTRDEMRLAGYPDDTPEIDVCAGIEWPEDCACD